MMRLLFALGIGLALAAPAQAQTASLSGTVVDESGAVVPGATVMLAGPGTHHQPPDPDPELFSRP